LTASGNLLWTKLLEGPSVGISALTTDVSGQIYLGGTFDAAYFNGQLNPFTLSAGFNDGYILKLTPNGVEIWLKTFGGTRYDALTDLKTDTIGNVYFTGSFQDTAWFNNSTDSLYLIAFSNNPSAYDGFTAKLDSIGNFEWAKSFGNGDTTLGMGGRRIEIDSIGNVYTLASIKGAVVFNAGFENILVNAVGDYSLAIAKHNNYGSLVRVQKADGSQYILGNGIAIDNQANLYFTGIFKTTNSGIDMDPSLDTSLLVGNNSEIIFVAKWSQCSVETNTISETACNNFTWNNVTYTESGTYTKTLTTSLGCDSIAVLNLTVLQSIDTSQNVNLCYGETLTVGNNTYNQSGVYQDVLIGSNGCDSTLTTTLFIDTLQAETNITGQSITAINYPSNATFQWLDCNNNFSLIVGETNAVFTPIIDGNYAVLVSNFNCSDTSDCVNFTITGLWLTSIDKGTASIYPNPTNGILSIELSETLNEGSYFLFDNLGRQILKGSLLQKKTLIDMNNINSGIYHLKILDTYGNQRTFKIIRE
jgi:hypothetical protein